MLESAVPGRQLVPSNYSFDDLAERALAAKVAKATYLARLEEEYVRRCENRKQRGIPAVAFCGHGRAGKDTSAEYVCKRLGLVYPKSASWQALPLVAHMAGVPAERAWDERHENRVFWIHACNALRVGDMTLLGRLCLGAGDVLAGPRGLPEFREYRRVGTIDWAVWVDRDVPVDPTMEFIAQDCDFVVPNHGTLDELYAKWDRLLPLLYGRVTTNQGVRDS